MSDADRPHSERYFTDARDHWWHEDYLALMAKRLALPEQLLAIDTYLSEGDRNMYKRWLHLYTRWKCGVQAGQVLIGAHARRNGFKSLCAR
jgi:hypothetical protein